MHPKDCKCKKCGNRLTSDVDKEILDRSATGTDQGPPYEPDPIEEGATGTDRDAGRFNRSWEDAG